MRRATTGGAEVEEEAALADLLREAERALARGKAVALLLDYDGTLVPLAPLPSLARPTRRLLALLARLAASPRLHVAVVSGRRTAELRRLLPVPGLWLAGEHGAEIRGPTTPGPGPSPLAPESAGEAEVHTGLRPGGVKALDSPGGAGAEEGPGEELEALEAAALVLARLAGLAHPPPVGEDLQTGDGFLLERKKSAVALHYRLVEPGRAQKVLAELENRRPHWERRGLEVLHGKKVVEVRRRGWHKGRAAQALKALWPEAVFFYLGDDRTDEDAFATLSEQGAVTVLVAGKREKRPTKARRRLSSPRAVRRFLERLLHLVEPGQEVGGQ